MVLLALFSCSAFIISTSAILKRLILGKLKSFEFSNDRREGVSQNSELSSQEEFRSYEAFGEESGLFRVEYSEVKVRYYFLDIIVKYTMSIGKQCILLCLFLGLSLCVSEYFSDYRQGFGIKKGLTFQATVWPE